MSLLQNEDFVLYQLRTSYLSNIKDGVGERLITVNPSVLNNPAFRAGGWTAHASEIKRTYSPPIPTAVTSDYFQAPRSAGLSAPAGFGDEEEEGGLVTGGGGSNDTVGPSMNARRRRRREQLEEDDSSDLSDESDDENDEKQRPLTQIKFQKMPVRNRAGSSPLRSSHIKDGPSLMITSPSRPPESGLRRGSLGALEAVKERARRDTVTSSEMSSENELDASAFQRRNVRPSRPSKAAAANMLSQRIAEDERESEAHLEEMEAEIEAGAGSDGSSLSSFAGSVDSNLSIEEGPGVPSQSLRMGLSSIPTGPPNTSPKKMRQAPALLQALPPPRPISMIQPVSALTQALKAQNKKPESPFQRFATLSGEGNPSPLWIKIYVPFSKSSKPIEMPLRKASEDGRPVIAGDAIGLALYKYTEAKMDPSIPSGKMNVNAWVFRMYEDGEVEEDFPPITRTKPITDFTSNNNRPPNRRARDKPWDEFALVQASEGEFKDNEQSTPIYSKDANEAAEGSASASTPSAPTTVPISSTGPTTPGAELGPAAGGAQPFRNPVLGLGFQPSTTAKTTGNRLDAPAAPVSHATPRIGASKTITISFHDDQFNIRKITVDATTDTYIAEVFEKVCHKLAIDKALFVLRVSGTQTVAPTDRTVEALGERSELDLVRRRFVTDGAFGLSGSPGSSSPNAPLLISTGGTPKKGKKGARVPGDLIHPLAQKQDALMSTTAGISTYKRYAVTRKQPMSFASSSSRILALDGEYMHIMPSETGGGGGNKALFEPQGKTTVVPFSSVVGSKVSRRHPRMFRVVVYKERETKRYDFEASSAAEAQEIVKEIKKAVDRFNEGTY